ncbi:MAG: DUF2341 domain-containing protein, partial [Clostridiales bacterium]|nr:DUF2341 domain-containing protein [Clostridiales bacterium]
MALTGWPTIKKIALTIDHTVVDAALSSFPVRVRLGSSVGKNSYDMSAVFTELGANSLKIAVEDGNTGAQCYVEIERWDNSAGVAELWVRVPSVSASEPSRLHLYYDSSHADNTSYVGVTGSTPAQAVWDANFIAVFHLNQDPTGGADCVLDSTANACHGTPVGTMTSDDLVEGPVGQALEFDGSNDAINFAIPSRLTTATVEAVAKTTGTIALYDAIFGMGSGIAGDLILYAHSVTELRIWKNGA